MVRGGPSLVGIGSPPPVTTHPTTGRFNPDDVEELGPPVAHCRAQTNSWIEMESHQNRVDPALLIPSLDLTPNMAIC